MVIQLSTNPTSVKLQNNKEYVINLPTTTDRDCAFVLGVRKSGSTLLNKIILDLCYYNKVSNFSLSDTTFEQNILFKDWQNCIELNEVIKDGIFYIGFRSLPSFLIENELFKQRKKIFLVRDPRDAIVSEYFSVAYSHSVPKVNTSNKDGVREDILRRRDESKFIGIDQYVLQNACNMKRTILDYMTALDFNDDSLQIYRYEDVITNKQEWIEEIAQFLNLELPQTLLDDMLKRHDVIPSQETSSKFIRKALPGDHKEKLKSATIDKLNETFKPILAKFYA